MKRGFTLLELLVAVLLGSLIMLMIAGGLRASIWSWETVQKRVSDNYNRRSVLDLVKRQTSSLFFKRDADQLQQSNNINQRRRNLEREKRRQAGTKAGSQLNDQTNVTPPAATSIGFELPEGASFFKGNVQELNFISTVSFLSDFPGQVAVRYYVVQGNPEEDETLADMTSSREAADMAAGGGFGEGEAQMVASDEIDGNLYLYLEEKNLFLNAAMEQEMGSVDPEEHLDQAQAGDRASMGLEEEVGTEVAAVNTMKLLGPLRKFTVRFRVPGVTRALEADSDEDWAEVWDVTNDGTYPSAVEFTLFYETPGITDDLDTEELDGIRMVIPIYDTRNLVRGGAREPF